MERRLGVHISVAGGIDKGLERARDLGCSTVQIFSHNPRGWNLGRRDAGEIRRFKNYRKKFDIHPVFVHTSYLINLATSRQDLLNKSVDMIVQELHIADEIGAEYIVLHTGSASGDEPPAARMRAIAALRRVAEQGTWRAGLLLENTAGEKGDITSNIAELAEIMEKVSSDLITGICLDTCHAFSAGYDITSDEGVDGLAAEIGTHIGRDRLKLIHCNDSKKAKGSGVDRHEHIGEGTIGREGFKRFLAHPFFFDVPLVLETPKKSDEDDSRNLMVIRKLLE
jgi:deoxyribonuclease-4